MRITLQKLITTVIALTIGLAAFAQTGKINGKVIDKKNGEELIGVSVSVEGTSFGASTDLEGRFNIVNLKPGTYNLNLSYVGYIKKQLVGIVVKGGESSTINVALEGSSKELSEVVVQGELKKESASALLIQQKNSVTVSDGISADVIKKSPDNTTSDAMKRISGTSIQDNKFAIIRGLNDRYNSAYINGAPLPSTESDRKAFSFDIIPSNMVDNMVITKSGSPDLPGDFTGGLITINTKDIPEKKFISVGFGTSINSITTGKSGIQSTTTGKTDWLGLDDGTRKVPTDIAGRGFYHGNNQTIAEKAAASQKFQDNWSTNRISSLPLNYSLQIAGGNMFKFGKKNEFGYILSGSYNNSYRNTSVDRNRFNKPMIGDENQLLSSYTDETTKHELLTGAMANFGLKLNGNHKFSFKNAYTINTENVAQIRTGIDSYLDEQVPLVKNTYLSYQQNQLFTSQLIGEHFLTKSKLKVKWVLNYNKIKRDIPDFRRFSTRSTLMDPSTGEYTPYGAQVSNSIDITQTGRFFSTLDENIKSAGADFQLPIGFFTGKKIKTVVKVGGFIQQRKRDFQARAFGYRLRFVSDPNSVYNYQKFIQGNLDTLFSKNKLNDTLYIDEDFRPQDVYSAESNLKAAYVMFDQRMFSRFRVVYGARFESYQQILNTFELNQSPPKPLTIDTTFNDILPSINLTYELTEKVNLRLSGFRSLARPEFRELAPFAFYDFNLNTTVSGKPNLARTRINNYDFRFEYFPGEGQLISGSLFYKEFTNAIESLNELPGSDPLLSYTSDANATNYGLEVEIRKNFDFLDKLFGTKLLFRNFIFTMNYARIFSEVKIEGSAAAAGIGTRPLQGQSPSIINSSIQYYNPNSGLSVAIFVNRVGRRIAFVREKNGLIPDLWENPRTVVDLSIARKIYKGLEAKFTIGDLLAQDLIFYQDNNKNGKFDDVSIKQRIDSNIPASVKANFDNTVYRFTNGYNVSIGASYKF